MTESPAPGVSLPSMYVPAPNAVEDEDTIRSMVASARTGWFVTDGPGGVPAATLLPVIWRGDRVIAHMARANPQWEDLPANAPGLLIVTLPDAYISPTWYAAKAEHGRVVPTWNYSAVHLTGTVTVHEDENWLREAVTELTDLHEGAREEPWKVTDAPEAYIAGQLRGIVGIELTVNSVEGKAKLSQNRSDADRRGIVQGLFEDSRLRSSPSAAANAADVARAMDDA